ncbi:MAG: hypothetical protein K2U26_17555 [Cyclobacteriaceae bacterium]|nr:hypothetical protein [Cyclobacteriaceae bacterium]
MKYHFRKQKNNEENGIVTLQNLVELLDINVSKTSISHSEFHNDYPSLNYLEESLNEWNVDTMSVKIDSGQLQQIPLPAVAHFNKNNQTYFVVVKSISINSIDYVDPQKGLMTESIAEFEQKWTGVAMLVSKNEKSGERNFDSLHKEERFQVIRNGFLCVLMIFSLVSVILLEGTLITNYFLEWFPLLVTLISGLLVCILLFFKRKSSSSGWIEKLCESKGFNGKLSCNDVLNSAGANLFGTLNLSDVAIVYFVGKILAFHILLLTDKPELLISLFAILSLISVPITIFSVIYQAKVIKVFCLLCMATVLILWIEIVFLYPKLTFPISNAWDFKSVVFAMISFAVPIFCLIINQSYFVSKREVNIVKAQLNSIKRSPLVLQQMLAECKSISEKLDLEDEIILGNKFGCVSIVALLNPYCESCGKTFNDLKKLVNDFEHIVVVIRFSVLNPVVRHFAYLIVSSFFSEGNTKVLESLDDWFRQKNRNIADWHKSLSGFEHLDLKSVESKISLWGSWETNYGINRAPTIFIDGYQKPNLLSLLDFYPYFKSKLTKATS